MKSLLWKLDAPRRMAFKVLTAGALVASTAIVAERAWGQSSPTPAELAGPLRYEMAPPDGEFLPMFDAVTVRMLAGLVLSAQETALGIRPDQQEAWRAYTSALIALLPTGETTKRWTDRQAREKAEAFDLSDDLARVALERAAKAKTLQDAIVTLRIRLTDEQKDAAKVMQQRFVERMMLFMEWRFGADVGSAL